MPFMNYKMCLIIIEAKGKGRGRQPLLRLHMQAAAECGLDQLQLRVDRCSCDLGWVRYCVAEGSSAAATTTVAVESPRRVSLLDQVKIHLLLYVKKVKKFKTLFRFKIISILQENLKKNNLLLSNFKYLIKSFIHLI